MTSDQFARRRAAVIAAAGGVVALLAMACDNAKRIGPGLGAGPDPAACTHGIIAPDSTRAGVLNAASACLLANNYANAMGAAIDSSYAQSYTVHAAASTLYSVRMHFAPSGGLLDTAYRQELSLLGFGTTSGSEVLLAASDYNASRDNILYFYAGSAGTYSLRASGGLPIDTGAYTVSMATCPIVAHLTGAGAYTDSAGELSSTDCQQPWSQLNGADGDSAHVRYYIVHFDEEESRTITIVSHDYTPTFEIGGPGLDGMWNVDKSNGTSGDAAEGDTIATGTLYSGLSPGDFTLAVGGYNFADQGSYVLTISAETSGSGEAVPKARSARRYR